MSTADDRQLSPEFVEACERGAVFQRDPRLIGPDGFTPLAPEGIAAHSSPVTPGRIPPANHEHDAKGCRECACNAAPWSSTRHTAACTCLAAMTATIRPMPRTRGVLSDETLNLLGLRFLDMATAEALYRQAVLTALDEGSFSAVSEATGLSTNTLQRWKREAGR